MASVVITAVFSWVVEGQSARPGEPPDWGSTGLGSTGLGSASPTQLPLVSCCCSSFRFGWACTASCHVGRCLSQGPRVPGSQGPMVPGSQGPRVPWSQGPKVPGSQGPRVPGSHGPRVPGSQGPKSPDWTVRRTGRSHLNGTRGGLLCAMPDWRAHSAGLEITPDWIRWLPRRTEKFAGLPDWRPRTGAGLASTYQK